MDDKLKAQHIIKDPPSKETMRFLGMINTYPKNATFATQNNNEIVVMVVRRHIFKNISWMITAIFAFLLPTVAGLLVSYYDHNFNQDLLLSNSIFTSMNSSFLTVLMLFYYSFVVTYTYFEYIHWFYDIFIITNERYISIDFDILKGKTITDLPLTDIVDISEKMFGFLPTLIGYGNIEFKTLSEKFIVLEDIPEPAWFRDSFADLIRYIRAQTEADGGKIGKEGVHAGHATHFKHSHDGIKIDFEANSADQSDNTSGVKITATKRDLRNIEP